MKVRAQIDDAQIEAMNLTMQFTMSVREWRELMRQVPINEWPSQDLGYCISGILGHVSRATATSISGPPYDVKQEKV